MTLPVTGTAALALALVFGFAFGFLLHRGRVADYNTIVRQFLFQDFTVLKIMMTAIIVGGVGVFLMVQFGYAKFHIKPTDLLALTLGAALFGVGMVLYGYCPGTALAAIGGGSLHALVGAGGMLLGGILYALTFDGVKAMILPVGALGRVQLHTLLGISPWLIFAALAVVALALFVTVERLSARRA
ncbi:YeeE/YedE thiosulfate transporter family protein [Phreatobacter sp.]|uniref:YeeE/YedE thiosulfate transporter family protein n=1 Tax=Phreatobacter sp. TaxID=1966341 RepID=UPI0025CEC72C|nr:YeeE/YedE thiosulfate transporter family protein [Phreatobacter sp.]